MPVYWMTDNDDLPANQPCSTETTFCSRWESLLRRIVSVHQRLGRNPTRSDARSPRRAGDASSRDRGEKVASEQNAAVQHKFSLFISGTYLGKAGRIIDSKEGLLTDGILLWIGIELEPRANSPGKHLQLFTLWPHLTRSFHFSSRAFWHAVLGPTSVLIHILETASKENAIAISGRFTFSHPSRAPRSLAPASGGPVFL